MLDGKTFSDSMRDAGMVRKHLWVKEEHWDDFESLMKTYGFRHPGQLLSLMIKNQQKVINR